MFADVGTARIFFDTVGSALAVDGERMVERPALIVMHGGPGFDHSTMRDVLGIVKPVVYGNSFGGMVAMAYAARHPDHPSKLILSSTAARMRFDETYRMMEERGGKDARAIAERFWTTTDDGAIADYMRVCMPFYNPPGGNAELQAQARRRAILRGDTLRYFSTGEMRNMDARAGLAKIKCPTLITVGDYDPITPVICSREIHEAMPRTVSRLEVFKGAGHGVHRDQPDEAERVMRAFLSA